MSSRLSERRLAQLHSMTEFSDMTCDQLKITQPKTLRRTPGVGILELFWTKCAPR